MEQTTPKVETENKQQKLLVIIKDVPFECNIDTPCEKYIGSFKYVFNVTLSDKKVNQKKCNVSVAKFGDYTTINNKEKEVVFAKHRDFEKKLKEAHQKTKDNLAMITEEFQMKLAEEKEFGEKFFQDNEKLLALIAGDKRISLQSQEKIDLLKSQETISVKQIKSEKFTWTMKLGQHCYIDQLGMNFWFYEKEVIKPLVQENSETINFPYSQIKDSCQDKIVVRDVFLKIENDNFELSRMQVLETDQNYICQCISMNDNGDYLITSDIECEIFKKDYDGIYPIPNKYKITDFKIGEKVWAIYIDDDGESNLSFYDGKISKINQETLKIFFPADRTSCTVTLDQVWKHDDIPLKFRDKLV
ncbi:MAG: hypothetical protein Dasosvirus15_4 [Dasosvirus sp.]|uniref:Uncharacterized protein n=1 Tax=Dasosvirus sp. TaxID=2487764 RepID=A0A3G4ZUF1_9VIRU|nr:MAG: hypothetical protein Dasosvirus15_4 [Dasosvirus sp.]